MKNLLNKFRYYGTSLSYPRWLNRNIIVANSISIATATIVVILVAIHVISHPEENIFVAGLVTNAIILSVLFIHRAGYHRVGRTVLTVGLVFGVLALTIARKMTSFDLSADEHILSFARGNHRVLYNPFCHHSF